MSTILVTGAAGFVGFSVSRALLEDSDTRVVGVDNINDYYSPALKNARLRELSPFEQFSFHQIDIGDPEAFGDLVRREKPSVVIHLAAQAGVRYSLDHPFAYAHSNMVGHLSVLEACRALAPPVRLVYASSSSVYGEAGQGPFQETDRVDNPVSLYAATKRADELMSATYAHLYGLEQIGLRFFTVYGPWGRPDMAYWGFTDKIMKGEPIDVYNHGNSKRDFTYIDDIVDGVISAALKPVRLPTNRPHKIYNLGNHEPVDLMAFVETLEKVIGVKANKNFLPMQPGDVTETYADISEMGRDFGYKPKTDLATGLSLFFDWFRTHRKLLEAA